MAHAVGEAELLDGGGAVPAADNGDGVGVGEGLCDGAGAIGEGVEFEDAHGAVPDDSAGRGDDGGVGVGGFGTDVEAHLVAGDGVGADGGGGGVGFELGGADDIGGDVDFVGVVREELSGVSEAIGVEKALPDFVTLGFEEGEGHASADDEVVDFGEEGLDDLDLVSDLRSTEDGDKRALGGVEGSAEVFELFLDEEAGVCGEMVGDAFGAGVGAVGGAEGIVDIELGEGGELGGEVGIVGFFLGVEANVFEEADLAVFEGVGALGDFGADNIGEKGDVLDEELGQASGDGGESEFGVFLAFWPSEVAAQDDACALGEEVFDGGEGFGDAAVVGDVAVFDGDIEIASNEDAFAGGVDIADSLLIGVHGGLMRGYR